MKKISDSFKISPLYAASKNSPKEYNALLTKYFFLCFLITICFLFVLWNFIKKCNACTGWFFTTKFQLMFKNCQLISISL